MVYVEPDEELLKKEEDPYEKKRKEEEELQKQQELEEQQNALKQVKKPPITYSKFNKRDVPFIWSIFTRNFNTIKTTIILNKA